MRALFVLVLLAACGEPARPTAVAPVAVDVPPMPSSSAPVLVPPPDPPKSEPAPVASESPEPTPTFQGVPAGRSAGSFDKGAAAMALAGANAQQCAIPGGPIGPGHVTVTFAPDGSVAASSVDAGPYPGTSVGGCIAQVFGTIRVPPFAGGPVRVGKAFVLR